MYPTSVIIGLGSNVGNFHVNFQNAIKEITKFSELKSMGNIYVSKPYGFKYQKNFYNTALEINTNCQPLELLTRLQSVEVKLLKNKKILNGPRKIDLDIIFYGNKIINNSKIVIPHPRAIKRDFVLRPILDIKPFFKHPVKKITIKEALFKINSKYVIKSLNRRYFCKKFF